MVRTQISLPEEQYERAKRTAEQRGVSFAELVRQALVDEVADDHHRRRVERSIAAAGRFSSGDPRGGADHDDAFDPS
ncbi:MAG TPA: CopG family transcriptional regulator [Nitriliruptorales bacterium]